MSSTWSTPFTQSPYSAIRLIGEPYGDSTVLVVVAPGGLDVYPKYLVSFSKVFFFSCEEESGTALDLGQSSTPENDWAYIWPESPYARGQANTAFGADKSMVHYVIVGGDDIVSVVSAAPPMIELVDSPKELNIAYAV